MRWTEGKLLQPCKKGISKHTLCAFKMYLSFDSINSRLEIYPNEIIRTVNKFTPGAFLATLFYDDRKADTS